MSTINKKYDVIILTHCPSDDLVFSIEKLLRQSIKPNKIILYNTDASIFFNNINNQIKLKKILKNKKVLKVDIEKKDFDHGRARNEAMKLTNSNYVLFMTDDAIPYNKDMAKNMLSAFYNKNVAAVYARQIAKNNAPLKEKYVREFNYPAYDIVKDKTTEKKYGIKNCFCSNSCCMYDKKIFIELKGFKENITQNEDMLYAYKSINNGFKIVYKANAKVLHSHNLSYISQFKRNYDIGVFQKQNKSIYKRYVSENEGKKLVLYVNKKLLKDGHIIKALDFTIECAFRYLGFKLGKI